MTLFLSIAVPLLAFAFLVYSYQRKKRFLETPIPLRVRDWQRYGERYTAITLERMAGEALPPWTAGSHIVVNVAGPAGAYRRAYSLLGGNAHTYEIVVAEQPHGRVSGSLLGDLRRGQIIQAQPPRGRFFKLTSSDNGKICLIGGGVGIAPLIPMALQALEQGHKVHLIHAVRHAGELIRREALQHIAHQNPDFRYTAVVSREPDPGCITGRLDVVLLEKLGLHRYAGDVYLCGATGFVQEQVRHLQYLGCSGKVHTETFTGNDAYLPHQITVGNKTFRQGHAPTLLAACEENGVLPFAECRTGHCLNCRATLYSGRVAWLTPCNKPAQLPPDTILTCACVPSSDIAISLPGQR